MGNAAETTFDVDHCVIGSGFASIVLWGPEHVQVYNDAYSRLIGD